MKKNRMLLVVLSCALFISTISLTGCDNKAKEEEQKQRVETFYKSFDELRVLLEKRKIKSLVIKSITHPKGISFPLLGSTAHKSAAQRAEQGIWMCLTKAFSDSTITLYKQDAISGSIPKPHAELEQEVKSYAERGMGQMRVEDITLTVADESGGIIWTYGWNLMKIFPK